MTSDGGGRWDDWFWRERCPGCRCEGAGDPFGFGYEVEFQTTLECFCCRYQYHCEPGSGSLCSGWQTIIEYDCDRRLYIEFGDNTVKEFRVDTTTGELVGASLLLDSGVCSDAGMLLRGGEWETPSGCKITSERTCEGCCGGAGGMGGNGGVGAFELQP